MTLLNHNNSIMREEIFSQPNILLKCSQKNQDIIEKIVTKMKEIQPKSIYFVARGSSEHACFFAQYVAEIYGGIPAKILNPSVITLYHSPLDLSNSMVFGVSQSGGAKDVALVLEHAKSCGALTVALTNGNGVVNQAADMVMNNGIGKECALPATKSYTSQAFLMATIIAHYLHHPALLESLQAVPCCMEMALAQESAILELAHRTKNAPSLVLLSRGITSSIMQEAELKLQETATVDTRAYAASDYCHGPFSLTSEKPHYIFALVEQITDDFTLDVYQQMKKKNITATVITNKNAVAAQFANAILLPPQCEGLQGGFSITAIMQLLACHLAVLLEKNPDQPQGVSKSVVTI